MKGVMVTGHKGGIGKTLIACNLALYLSQREKKTALIDADIASSNVAEFLNVEEFMELDREKFYPGKVDGLQVFSMSLLVGQKAVSMTGKEYSELLRDAVEYGEWDAEYAICDMPAGSSNEFKEVVSVFGDDFLGSVIVTQPAHKVDADRVITLHLDNGIPIIGLIENMSGFKGGVVEYDIFGKSIVDQLGEEYEVDVLGRIPLSMEVRSAVQNRTALSKDLASPIISAVDKIVTLKPQKPGFLAKMKKKAKDVLQKALVRMVLAANKQVDIPSLQKTYGYPGGRVIRLNVMDEKMEEPIVQTDFRLWEGRLVVVENPEDIDCQIDIKPRAFAMAVLGNRTLTDGSIYDLEAAWRMGDARVYGRGDTIRGAYFFKAVWKDIRENKEALQTVKPLLEMLL